MFLLIGVTLLIQIFSYANFNGKIYFDGSDLRSADFESISELPDKIQNGKVTFSDVKYVDLAKFDNRAINALIKLMNNIDERLY